MRVLGVSSERIALIHFLCNVEIRKAWRQKIEAWLSENEKEERAGEQLQRKAKQLHQANRRSFEDSGEQNYDFNVQNKCANRLSAGS